MLKQDNAQQKESVFKLENEISRFGNIEIEYTKLLEKEQEYDILK